MKTRIILILTALICVIFLLPSCSETESHEPDINEAVWDLYPDLPFTELISNVLDSEQEFLKTSQNEVNTYFSLSEGWVQTERYTFDGSVSEKSNIPYTLTMSISSKSTDEEKEIAENTTSYIFLEFNPDNNTLSICASFSQCIKTNGTYETVVLSTLPKQSAENELIGMLENNSVENVPERSVVPEDAQGETSTRRYNHKPADATQMCLEEFPGTTLYNILSRFDDAFGGLMKKSDVVTVGNEHNYTSVSFNVICEYDWKKSETLNEFTDGRDNYQPYTYSAVYTAGDQNGISLIATLDVFAEIEPKHNVLKLRESVFAIEYAGETLFHDVHDEQETLVLLGTIMQYHPEDAVVTPAPEDEAVQEDAETEAAA